MTETRQRIYFHFSSLFEYPQPGLAEAARRCADLLTADYPEAAGRVRTFLDFVESTALGRLEEIYTGTFDVSPTCTIYAGYQLFGESYKRGEFLVRLKEKYREHGFAEDKELADHLAVLLRFLAGLDEENILAQELIEDCLVPSLRKMNGSFECDSQNPYAYLLGAATAVLEQVLAAKAACKEAMS